MRTTTKLYDYIIHTYTVQLKGNVALARYCLACLSNAIHSNLETLQRPLVVCRVLNHLNQPRELSTDDSLEIITREMTDSTSLA